MSTISWTTADPDASERIIAVGLCRRHKRARRIKPSQGDGGLDVLVPVPGGSQLQVEDYQVRATRMSAPTGASCPVSSAASARPKILRGGRDGTCVLIMASATC